MNDTESSNLRDKAETLVIDKFDIDPSTLSTEEIKAIIHELEVHKIELEMQNDELKNIQSDLEKTLSKYSELYDFAPVAYVTLDCNKVIREANLVCSMLFGVERSLLIGSSIHHFIDSRDSDTVYLHYESANESRIKQSCDVNLVNKMDETIVARLDTLRVPIGDEGAYVFKTAITDITKRKKIAEALSASELRYRRLFESAQDGILILDFNTGQILDINPYLINMLGYSHEEYLGKKLWEISPFKDKIENKALFDELHEKGYVRYEDLPLQTSTGGIAEVEFISNSYPVNGQTFIQCNIRDVTDRKIAERALQESEARFFSAFQTAPYAKIITCASDGKIVEVNDALLVFTGYSREELLDNSTITLGLWVNAEDRNEVIAALNKNGKVINKEYKFRVKDGEIRIGLYSSTFIYIKDVPYIMSSLTDITDQNLSNKLLHIRLSILEFASTHSLSELLQYTLDQICELTNSPVGFYHFITDNEKSVSLQAWSTNTLKNFCSVEEKEGHYPVDQAGVWAEALHTREPVIHNDYASLPNRKGMPEGHTTLIRELVVPLPKENQIVAILGIGNKPIDYTEKDIDVVAYLADVAWETAARKKVQEELILSQDRIKVLEVAKTKDLLNFSRLLNAGIAHELRTPMQAITNCFELIEEEIKNGCQAIKLGIESCPLRTSNCRCKERIMEFGNDGIERADYSVKVLNSLSEYSKIAGAKELHTINVIEELKTIMKTLVLTDDFKGLEQKQFNLVDKIEKNKICNISVNRVDFSQLITNLCRNAKESITHDTPQITIDVSEQVNTVVIKIIDNGKGVDKELGDTIFSPYVSTKGKQENQGLGLAMAKDMLSVSGGSIKYNSVPGHTEFLVSLPIAN